MAEIKWIKLATCMPDDERMKLIDAMPERDTIHYIWIRLLVQAARTNSDGEMFLSEDMPYTHKMLATIFSRPLGAIKLALKTLSRLGMIEIDSNKIIRIVNWDKHQNVDGMERIREQNRKRAENNSEKKKLENNTLETDDNNNDFIKNTSNVTQNKSNVTVTVQNKREIENKNKNKNKNKKREIDIDKNNTCEVKDKSSTCDEEEQSNLSQNKKLKEIIMPKAEEVSNSVLFEENNFKTEVADDDIDLKSMELMKYHEKITGKVGSCDPVALRSAIDIYGEKMVKRAMDVGFERNCPEIKYAIGVLKNWKREGYPEDDTEVKKNWFRNFGKSNVEDKNPFAGFKPKEPRKLTEEERKKAIANFI